jgi:hypothetical protein
VTDVDEAREQLHDAYYELRAHLGGYGPVVEARDALAAALTIPSNLTPDDGIYTAFTATDYEGFAMPPVPDDEMGRVYVKPADETAVKSEPWTATVDELTGFLIQMRRADCGAGCRCATEVRITQS